MTTPTGHIVPNPDKPRVPYIPNIPGEPGQVLQLDADGQPIWDTSPANPTPGPIDSVQFNTAYVPPAHSEGLVHWNGDDGTLEIGLPGGTVFLQVGQEVMIRVRNSSGVQIDDGKVVYISGATGNKPTIELADPDSYDESRVIGWTTEDIGNNAQGYVTTFGLVRGINTVGCTEGDPLWLDDDGGFTTVEQEAPRYKVLVGYCLYEHVNDGIIFANPIAIPTLTSLSDVHVAAPMSEDDLMAWDSGDNRFEPRQATVDVPIALTLYEDQNSRNLDQNIHGGLDEISTGDAVSSGSPVNLTVGLGKVMIAVIAGADVTGTLTITGTTVNRNTGVETPADTVDIPIDAISSTAHASDAEGNTMWDFTNCYITNKWFKGAIVISTTDLNISDFDTYVVAFNQFNDTSGITVDTLDATLVPTNVAAWAYMYLYSVEVTGWKVDVNIISSVALPSADSVANRFYRLREGGLGVAIDGATDGIFLEIFLGPDPQQYITQMTIYVWATLSLPITLT